MKPLHITLPDGSVREVAAGTTAQAIAASIGQRLEKASVAAKVDDVVYDLTRPLPGDCKLQLITRDSKEALEVLRHSTAHLLAQAIKELFPTAQITIGPVIEDGFYYDIDCEKKLSPEDLPAIEKKMEEIAARKLDIRREEWPKEKAVAFFEKQGEHYKAEIIRDLGEATVSVYHQGEFTDLCRGPHVPNTERLGKFKLLSVAGAYWRGDEKNKMLQRIYGTAFANQKDLDEYLTRLEEARKRDHRKLGPELGLFTFLPISPAMPFYLPKGTLLFNLLAKFIREQMNQGGYQEVICPQLMQSEMWKVSGHWDYYKDNMFLTDPGGEGEGTMSLKPMNCPGHAALFKTSLHSYRDLPLRYAEFSRLHRYERGGVIHGLMRTRTFSQDDAHIFCTPDQFDSEVRAVIDDTYRIYKLFGFRDILVRLATRPEKSMGTAEIWEQSTKALERNLNAVGLKFEWLPGEGAFYGPKIEFHIKDSIGRYWQCGTIQADFNLPERFELEYVDTDGSTRRPIMLHRAIFGSLERFMGILVEHFNGHFPLWLSPVQAKVIGVTEDQTAYAQEVASTLQNWGVRAETDLRYEKLGYKIREAQVQKIPFMVVLGQKEMESRTVTVRKSSGENLPPMSFDELHKYLEPQLKAAIEPRGGSQAG
ncbi:threonine--tRNA ligase [bacterium]|nr:threonine--tRNA ligase [bacterium]